MDEVIDIVRGSAEEILSLSKGEFSVSMVADGTKVEYLRYGYPLIDEVVCSDR